MTPDLPPRFDPELTRPTTAQFAERDQRKRRMAAAAVLMVALILGVAVVV